MTPHTGGGLDVGRRGEYGGLTMPQMTPRVPLLDLLILVLPGLPGASAA
jgi:hypothetical protein